MKKLFLSLVMTLMMRLTASADANYSMVGKIGGKYDVVFNFTYSQGRMQGAYYYVSQGAAKSIPLEGHLD